VLAYFDTGVTNGRTEGFNNKAKLVKRQGRIEHHRNLLRIGSPGGAR